MKKEELVSKYEEKIELHQKELKDAEKMIEVRKGVSGSLGELSDDDSYYLQALNDKFKAEVYVIMYTQFVTDLKSLS